VLIPENISAGPPETSIINLPQYNGFVYLSVPAYSAHLNSGFIVNEINIVSVKDKIYE